MRKGHGRRRSYHPLGSRNMISRTIMQFFMQLGRKRKERRDLIIDKIGNFQALLSAWSLLLAPLLLMILGVLEGIQMC